MDVKDLISYFTKIFFPNIYNPFMDVKNLISYYTKKIFFFFQLFAKWYLLILTF